MRCNWSITAWSALACLLPAAFAQNPVINPRGVLNPVTMEPAPSRVARGGPILITGINLGPVAEVKAAANPLPTTLADPAVEVLINNRPAPLFSVSATRVLAQVPWEIQAGGGQGVLAQVIVRRGEARSRPATVRIVNSVPGIRTANDQGWGAAGTLTGNSLLLSLTGLGPTDPAARTGELPEGDAKPATPVRAFVGGLPAKVEVALSKTTVGEYTARLDMPEGSKPGDIVTVLAGNASSNRPLVGRFEGSIVQYLPLPEGASAIRVLRAADLRGNFLIGHGPRGDDGCYPSWLFDLGRSGSSKTESCLIAANANVATPVAVANESSALAALAGPATGDAATGVSSKMVIFQPGKPDAMTVDLPAPVSTIVGGANGTLAAIQPGENPRVYFVDPDTGEVTEGQAGAPGGGVPGGAGGGGAGGAGNINALLGNFTIDLGDGLTHPLSAPMNLGQGRFAMAVGDDPDKPARARLALLNNSLEVTDSRPFPDGWTALVALPAPQPANPPPGGGIIPGNPLARFRATQFFDGTSQTLFILSRKPDGSAHAWTAFRGAALEPSTVEFPAGWFAATCRPQNLQFFNLELSRRVALFGAGRESAAAANPCPSNGWLVLDLASRQTTAVALPGSGSVNTRNNAGDVNDFLFAANNDPSNRNISDTLFVLDSAAGSAFRLDLPAGVSGFTGLQPIPELSGLLAVATNQVPGDAGLVFFDLANERQTMLSVPEGFASIAPVGIFANTRKAVARGTRTGNIGSQYLIYELGNGELTLAENPEGVAFVGVLPPQGGGGQGGGGQGGGVVAPGPAVIQVPQVVNSKSNIVTAIAYGANRQPVGIVAVRVP